ncbi:hypothetical protein DL764_004721 [Monosporascus ibericus]|uniref:Alcohol dehydrogenase-like C-terminal domain-containing protein n=1 Tax=Monosporascus ibericus TaxID=155417 RepID=A0A4Q4TF50_9PEZI|nr:hypothetical protein DL764_004721 [Monosporascus ibericus]
MSPAKSLIVPSVSSPLALRVESGPVPEAGPGTAVVEILASLIGPAYGSMLSCPNPHFVFPTPSIFGNNSVGRVVSTGPDSVTLKKGQLVFVDSYIEARDDPEVSILIGLMDDGSEKSKKLANDAWRNGTWTTHAVVPLENAIPLDEDALLGKLGYDVAELAYLTRLSVAYGGMSTINVKAGETVIVGPATGHFGGAAVEVASALGARVIALGRNTEVLSRLKATIPRVETVVLSGDIDKDTNAIQAFGSADAFVDFTPTAAQNVTHISSAILALRCRGRVALMGGTSEEVPIPYMLLVLNSIEIKGRWMYSRKELREVIKMVENGVLKLGKSVGHEVNGKFSLEDWDVALDTASKHTAWGNQVLFTP